MSSLFRRYFIISVICFCAAPAVAQDSIVDMARARWEAGMHTDAYLLLDRAIYFGFDSLNWRFYKQKATFKMLDGEYHRAGILWDNVYDYAPDTLLQNEALFLKAYCLLRLARFNDFYEIIGSIPDGHELKVHQYKVCALIYQGYIDSAAIIARNLFPDRNMGDAFSKCRRINRKKEGTAFALSLIVPGLGHAYNGDAKNAVNSFLLNLSMGALFYNTAVSYTFLDGWMIMGPWTIRYYVGGAKVARENCGKLKEEAKNRLVHQILGNGSR